MRDMRCSGENLNHTMAAIAFVCLSVGWPPCWVALALAVSLIPFQVQLATKQQVGSALALEGRLVIESHRNHGIYDAF